MRRLLILLLGFSLVWMFADRAFAQGTDIRCSQIVKSTEDTVRVPSFKAKPNTVIKVPIFVQNRHPVGAFQLSIQYDTLRMTPVFLDTTYIQFHPAGRFVDQLDTVYDEFDNILRIDTISRGLCFLLPDQKPGETIVPRLPNVVTLLSQPELVTPDPGDPETWFVDFDTVEADRGIIAYIDFQLKPAAEHNDTILFQMYRVDKITAATSTPPYDTTYNGCYGTDFSAFVPQGTDTVDVITYPTIPGSPMRLVIDSNYVEVLPPVISSFTANPTSVASGGSSTLSWTVTGADSIVISRGTTRLTGSTSLIGNFGVSNITAATTYTLTAWKATVSDSRNVTVSIGGGGGTGNAPQVTSANTTYTVNEAETMGFTVNASDPDGGSITLFIQSPSPLPSGVSFSVSPGSPGSSPLTGTFNWTPTVGQNGVYNFVFTSSDGVNTGQRTITVIVDKLQFDRLFSTSTPPPEGTPVGGLKGTTGVLFPINLVSKQSVYGVQFDLDYPDSLIRLDSILTTDRIPEYIVYDNIGVTPGLVRILAFGMSNDSVVAGTGTAILQLAVTIDSSATPWTAAEMKLRNGRESVDPDPLKGSLPLVCDTLGIVEIDSLGDVNLDHYIDVADIVSIVGHIIGNFDLATDWRRYDAGDCVVNDTINVFDLVGDINAIYGIPLPVQAPPIPNESAIAALAYGDLQAGQTDLLMVTSELPEAIQVAGVELTVDYDPGAVQLGKPSLTEDAQRFALQYRDDGSGRMKVLLYHMAPILRSGELIQGGQTAQLVKIPMTAKNDVEVGNKAQLRLSQLLLSTANAGRINVTGVDVTPPSLPSSFLLRQNYPNPFNPTTKIEFSIAGGAGEASLKDVTLEIYNVLGQKVRSLVNGKMSVGPHTVEWDATSESGDRVASGIYLYRLTVGSESQTRKMVFLK